MSLACSLSLRQRGEVREQGALRVNENRQVDVKILERVGEGSTYLVSWKEK